MGFIGRYQLGQSVPIFVRTKNSSDAPVLPDDVPVATAKNTGGTTVKQVKLPILDRFGVTGLFFLPLFLDTAFVTGQYSVFIAWTSGSWPGEEVDSFEVVAGGDDDGAVIAMHHYDRPHGRFLVQQLDSGALVKGRNPRL